jgi:hypothetical protein
MKLNIQKPNKIMINCIKKQSICLLLFIGMFFTVHAQSNPGYMGSKEAISLDVNANFGAFFTGGNLIHINYGLSYEYARNKTSAFKFGIKRHSGELDAEYFYYRAAGYYVPSSSEYLEFIKNSGKITYNINEICFQANFYREDLGAIAPFGPYIGIELSGSMITPKTNTLSMSGNIYPELNYKPNNVYGFNTSIHWGSKRMINDNLGYYWDFASGFTLLQSGQISLFGLEYEEYEQPKDIIEFELARQLAYSKLIQVSAGLIYLF